MNQIRCALVAFVLLLVATVAQGQSAERPIWKVGDKWTYHYVSYIRHVESTFTREVVESLPNGQSKVQFEDGKNVVFDSETNSLDPRGAEYSWKRYSFPLFVGKQWTHKREIAVAPNNGYENASWEVTAYESIAVPAGTFECFRVQGTVWQTRSFTLYGQGVTHQDVTYWYCPAVKWVARVKEKLTNSWEGGTRDAEWVLTSFVGDR